MRKSIILSLLAVCLLCGCGVDSPEPVEEPTHVPLRPISNEVSWDSILVNAITPVTAFEIIDDTLSIFPYNDNASYIKVEKFIFSSNNLFGILVKGCSAENIIVTDSYSLCTLPSGESLAFIPTGENKGYLISTRLPSAYCKKVVDILCLQLGL